MKWCTRLAAACGVLFGIPMHADNAAPKMFTGIAVGLSGLHPKGTLQTPTGGRTGTSTLARPTLAELDLAGEASWWFAVKGDLGRSWSWHLRYAHVRDEGEAVLRAPLITQGRHFASGETLRTQTTFHEHRLEVLRTVAGDERRTWDVGIRLGVTAFSLEIDGSGVDGMARLAGDRVERAYHIMEVGITTRFEHRFGSRWRGELAASLAPRIHRYAGRNLFETHLVHTFEMIDLAIGVRYDTFKFHDAHKQELPNDLDLRRLWLPEVRVRLKL